MRKYLVIIPILYSCSNVSSDSYLKGIVLFDTTKIAIKRYSEWDVRSANYKPSYLGKLNDTIVLNHNIESDYFLNSTKFSEPNPTQLNIYVDTSKRLINTSTIPDPPPKGSNFESLKPEKYAGLGYAIFVTNISRDTLVIGYDMAVSIVLEAKNKHGDWQKAESVFFAFCGTGINDLLLPPDFLLITATKIYEGDYQTILRIRFGEESPIYSNEFEGSINYSFLK